MKKLLIVMVIVLGSLGFSTSVLASQAVAENPKITSEQAKEIALKQSKNGKFKEIELKHEYSSDWPFLGGRYDDVSRPLSTTKSKLSQL